MRNQNISFAQDRL